MAPEYLDAPSPLFPVIVTAQSCWLLFIPSASKAFLSWSQIA